MSDFLGPLRERARERRLRWYVVACGSRNDTLDAFRNALRVYPDEFVVLLVDSEEAVVRSPKEHLQERDRWQFDGTDDDSLHLMAQAMETWMVADPNTLARYYGQRFQRNALPGARDLETVKKPDIERALKRATRRTQKGEYHKIRHASQLLAKIDSAQVRARCSYCDRLFKTTTRAIQ